MSKMNLGFIPETKLIPIERLLPSRKVEATLAKSPKFQQIRASIIEIGMIEPITISPLEDGKQFWILDGHLRLEALKQLEYTEALCCVATDNEFYTYNNRINRLSSIQEHHMLRRAIERGVTPERLARALSLDISHIRKKVNLLTGLCDEAIKLLGDRNFSADVPRMLRRMKPTRQIECVELMIAANSLTFPYIKALLAATHDRDLVASRVKRKSAGVTKEQMARMEKELANVQGRYKLVEGTYSQDVLTLVTLKGYVSKLLGNQRIAKFIRGKLPEAFVELEALSAADALGR